MKPIILTGSGCTQLLSYTRERPLAERPPASAVFTLSSAAWSPVSYGTRHPGPSLGLLGSWFCSAWGLCLSLKVSTVLFLQNYTELDQTRKSFNSKDLNEDFIQGSIQQKKRRKLKGIILFFLGGNIYKHFLLNAF